MSRSEYFQVSAINRRPQQGQASARTRSAEILAARSMQYDLPSVAAWFTMELTVMELARGLTSVC